jgi:hypothetical protein
MLEPRQFSCLAFEESYPVSFPPLGLVTIDVGSAFAARGHHGDYAHSFAKAVRSWPGIADIPAFTLPLVYRGLTRLTHRTVLFWHAGHEQAQSQVAQVREVLPCGRPL